jgi:hypothetical protein
MIVLFFDIKISKICITIFEKYTTSINNRSPLSESNALSSPFSTVSPQPAETSSTSTDTPHETEATQSSMSASTSEKEITPKMESTTFTESNSDSTETTADKVQKSLELIRMLQSLAGNDPNEENYICRLCSYSCHHLPSLKAHMWTHVTSNKFDYSVNTSIINAALDYENKLARNISTVVSSIRLNANIAPDEVKALYGTMNSKGTENVDDMNGSGAKKLTCSHLERHVLSTLEMLDYQEVCKRLLAYSNSHVKKAQTKSDEMETATNETNSEPMVAFKCVKCDFETIDMCVLRLHKTEHAN